MINENEPQLVILDEISGEGDIHIAYGEWRVNTGLDDRLFINK